MIFPPVHVIVNQENMSSYGTTEATSLPIVNLIQRDSFDMSEFILSTDTDETTGLVNLCYKHDYQDDASNPNNELIKNCRGVVFDGQNVVMKAFGYTDDYSSYDGVDKIKNRFQEIDGGLAACSVFQSHEGSLIRVFNFKGKWFLTTHRKLNAFKSKWSSTGESYGTSFKNALKEELVKNDKFRENFPDVFASVLDNFFQMLNPEKQYMFLVCNTKDNRIVCAAPDIHTMYHVGTFVNYELDLNDDIFVTKPQKLMFDSESELIDYVNNQIDPYRNPGVIVFAPFNKQFKVTTNEYIELFKLRGNQPSLKFRYLQLRTDEFANTRFRYLYPDYVDAFNRCEDELGEISKFIHTSYMNRFIHKQYTSVPVPEYIVMQTAHKWFSEDRDNRRVTNRVIYDILNEQNATYLNQMLKRHRHEKVVKNALNNSAPMPALEKMNLI